MPILTGRLKSLEHVSGFGGDVKVIIGEQRFFTRGNGKTLRNAENYVGRGVRIIYGYKKTRLSDYVLDFLLLRDFGLPRRYKEIQSIEGI